MLEQNTQENEMEISTRIATSPSERWVKKAAEWNPELSSKYRTSRMIGRPKKRWEDDINDFLKNNNMWINIAIDRKEWTRLEENTHCKVQNDRKN